MLRTKKTLALTLSVLFATPALALVPIGEEPKIVDTLLQGFIGDAIDDNCPTIEARKLRALGELNKLRDYALAQGYTSEEVRDYVTSKEEKAKGKAKAAEWLKAKGAEPGNPEAYCKIGAEEIAKDSLIGYLLRSTE
jgi:TPR repeat protein